MRLTFAPARHYLASMIFHDAAVYVPVAVVVSIVLYFVGPLGVGVVGLAAFAVYRVERHAAVRRAGERLRESGEREARRDA